MPKCENSECGYKFKEGEPRICETGKRGSIAIPLFFCGEGCLEQWKEDRETEISKPVNRADLVEGL